MYITFDVGGTDIKYGVVNEDFQFLMTDKMKSNAFEGGHRIIERLIEKVIQLQEEYPIRGVAISSAGVIDPYRGVVIDATDAIPNYIGTEIKELIEQATGLPTEVQNDVNSFALCEGKLGNAQQTSNYLTLTIGTGIGGAIVINNQLFYGNRFSAGEWGRMYIQGKKFESIASISALVREATDKIRDKSWNGEQIFALYDEGHPIAIEFVNQFYDYLAEGIGNLIYIFNPEKIIIGGGITNRGERMIEEIMAAIKKQIEPSFINATTIELAKYKNDSGMLGALVHYLQMQEKRKKGVIA